MQRRRLPVGLLSIVVVLVVTSGIVWGLRPLPTLVDIGMVGRGRLAVRVADDGVTRIRERYLVRAPLSGRMTRVDLHPGDEVVANATVITVLDPPDPALLDPRAEADAVARVETAKAIRSLADRASERAAIQVEYTKADLDRAVELFPKKAITHEELDAYERAWKTAVKEAEEAHEQIRVAEHVLGVANAALVRSRPTQAGDPTIGTEAWQLALTAPISGRVLRVIREGEGIVAAGAEIVEVGNPRDLEAVIDLISEDAVLVQAGDICEITDWGGGRPLACRVRVVEPRGFTKVSPLGVEEQRVNVIVDLDVPQEGPLLGDDYRVEAAITVDEVHDAVLVPLAAVFRRDGQEMVFLVSNGKAQQTPVTTGRRDTREAEVLAGLSGGETVILYPGDAVTDGAAVRTAKE
jgi:HlyD family secretion protein